MIRSSIRDLGPAKRRCETAAETRNSGRILRPNRRAVVQPENEKSRRRTEQEVISTAEIATKRHKIHKIVLVNFVPFCGRFNLLYRADNWRRFVMINAAIVGLGWWGRTLVESGQGSDFIRFVAGATRTVSPEVTAFADTYKLRLAENFDALLKDSTVQAVVLCTPHSMHTRQVVAAAQAGKHVFWQ